MTQEQTFMELILVSSLLTLKRDWAFHLKFNPFHATGLFLFPPMFSRGMEETSDMI